jgi:HK97 family phage major capsid protein/HK97 family phage prohead protease
MPIPQPHSDEEQSDFMSRCMSNQTMMDDYPEQDQRVAVCLQTWRDRDKESDAMHIKQTAAPPPGDDPLEYTMSDGSVDRIGDLIEPAGWRLDNFRRNPVALFGHNSSFPIGKWSEVAVRGGRLVGRLQLMEPVSDRLREIHAAVAGGVLRAVSVGFHANKYQPLEGSKIGGIHFLETELVECSLVSVPANPNALAVAKALGISHEGQRLIFGGLADADHSPPPRGRNGGLAETDVLRKPKAMNLSERIETARGEIVALQDTLSSQIEADDIAKSTETTNRIDEIKQRLDAYLSAEKALGNASEVAAPPTLMLRPNGGGVYSLPATREPPKAWAVPKTPEQPGYLFMRHMVAKIVAYTKKISLDAALQERYGNYGDFEVTRAVNDVFTRAATAPATMTTPGWADTLATTTYGEFLDLLYPGSIYGPLSSRGFRANLGRFAVLSMPTRVATPTVAGSFVAEGAPIPVRQAAFAPITIGLKKMAVISSYTREIAEHSNPQIEGILRQLIGEDTQIAIDTVLIDINPATSVRPAGLRNGVTGLTPTAGGGFTALIGDIKQMLAVLAAANSLRTPVWIMNPVQSNAIALTATANGVFPFKQEIDGNMLQGYPLIVSSTMPAGTVLLLDAADFMSVSGDDPRFEVSDQATLHYEDTTPLQLTTGPQGTAVVATPTRSMFQTDSLALRMILPMNWAMRRTGVIAWIAAVTW